MNDCFILNRLAVPDNSYYQIATDVKLRRNLAQ
jgi:hypothetical protein